MDQNLPIGIFARIDAVLVSLPRKLGFSKHISSDSKLKKNRNLSPVLSYELRYFKNESR